MLFSSYRMFMTQVQGSPGEINICHFSLWLQINGANCRLSMYKAKKNASQSKTEDEKQTIEKKKRDVFCCLC